MCNSFELEMKSAKYQRKDVSKDLYENFLNNYFEKLNFNLVDLETLKISKLITENLGIFGPFDDLTNKRIIYFNKKINSFKKPLNNIEKKEVEINKKIKTNYLSVDNIEKKEVEINKRIKINFLSVDQKINETFICDLDVGFHIYEDLLYKKYPKYINSENYFLNNGEKINRFKSMKDNGIKDGDNLILNVIE